MTTLVWVDREGRATPIVTETAHGGWDPLWSRDGRELFYFQGDSFMVVPVESTEPVFTKGPPRALFEWRYSQNRRGYDAAPGGQRS
jgi:hypothetical protein